MIFRKVEHMNYKWTFTCRDNGGKYQAFKISASDKTSAINKGIAKARKNASGDIITWDCKLNPTF